MLARVAEPMRAQFVVVGRKRRNQRLQPRRWGSGGGLVSGGGLNDTHSRVAGTVTLGPVRSSAGSSVTARSLYSRRGRVLRRGGRGVRPPAVAPRETAEVARRPDGLSSSKRTMSSSTGHSGRSSSKASHQFWLACRRSLSSARRSGSGGAELVITRGAMATAALRHLSGCFFIDAGFEDLDAEEYCGDGVVGLVGRFRPEGQAPGAGQRRVEQRFGLFIGHMRFLSFASAGRRSELATRHAQHWADHPPGRQISLSVSPHSHRVRKPVLSVCIGGKMCGEPTAKPVSLERAAAPLALPARGCGRSFVSLAGRRSPRVSNPQTT